MEPQRRRILLSEQNAREECRDRSALSPSLSSTLAEKHTMDPIIGYAITGAVSLTVGILLKYVEPKGKLYFWWPHTFRFKAKPNFEIQTDALTIQNLGRKEIEDVEIVMQSKPDCFDFSPKIPFEEINNGDGSFIFRIKSLAPKEFFTLQILSYTKLPNVLYIRSKLGPAERMVFRIQKVYSRWVYGITGFLIVAGFSVTLYAIIKLIILIFNKIN